MKNLKISLKIWLLVAIVSSFALVAIIGGQLATIKTKQVSIGQIETVMRDNHKTELKALVESAALTMEAGIAGLNDSQQVVDTLHKLNNPIRFFDNKSGYFFIYDLDGLCISLPPKQSLEGKSLIDLKDKNGFEIVRQFVKTARDGGGFVEYVWPKPPADKLEKKLTYVQLIPGTNYLIGTGIYIDDIEAQKAQMVGTIGTEIKPVLWWSAALLVLFFCLLVLPAALLLIRHIVTPVKQLQKMAHELEQGNLNSRSGWVSKDEIGKLASSLNQMAGKLSHYAEQAEQIATGDLTVTVVAGSPQDVLGNALANMVQSLRSVIGNIQSAGNQIDDASSQVSSSGQALSQGTTQAAAALEEISSAMNEMASQTSASAENANKAKNLADTASQAAANGGQQMAAMIAAMNEINLAGGNISKIIKTIDEIAFQTNLLALNAAVEAARAGQHGKGFAVVAEEVRNLAGRCAKAASETAELIQESVEKAGNGSRIANGTSKALEEIVGSISKVTDLVNEIATASNEQAQGIAQVNHGLNQIDQTVQQNTATSEESAAAAEELSSQAAQLRSMLQRFKLERVDKAPAQKLPKSLPQPAMPVPAKPAKTAREIGWGNLKPAAEPMIALDDSEFGRY